MITMQLAPAFILAVPAIADMIIYIDGEGLP
jgi:hypothetical protein